MDVGDSALDLDGEHGDPEQKGTRARARQPKRQAKFTYKDLYDKWKAVLDKDHLLEAWGDRPVSNDPVPPQRVTSADKTLQTHIDGTCKCSTTQPFEDAPATEDESQEALPIDEPCLLYTSPSPRDS